MFGAASRHASQHGGQWMRGSVCSARHYATSLTSSIRISSIPAPHTGEITVLSLNRPRARNAISRQLLTELSEVIDRLHADGGKSSTRAIVLASECDDAFCAGADLKERLTFTEEDTREFLTKLRGTFTRLSTLPIPTISAVASVAFGGGLELALCTNFRVLASTAKIGLPETRLAIVPGAGGTFRLPALIGETRARDLILTGRRVGGPEAYFLGLCDRLVEVTDEENGNPGLAREKVLEQAVLMASDICEGGPLAVQAAMQAVNGWKKSEAAENAAYDIVMPTLDRMEALKAFSEKRKPAFRGRTRVK